MAQNPREHLERLQMMLRQRRAGGGAGSFGPMRGGPGGLRSVIALAVLGLGGVLLSDSLFNGEFGFFWGAIEADRCSRRWSSRDQILQNQWCAEGNLLRGCVF